MANNWEVYYYETVDAITPVKDYISSLSIRERAKTLAFIGLLETNGPQLPRPYADFIARFPESDIRRTHAKLHRTFGPRPSQ